MIFILVGITVLIVFNLLSTQTITIKITNPSYNTYLDLEKSYSNVLICPCITTTIHYENFMSLSSILHPVCSSDLLSDRWLSILKQSGFSYNYVDWRNRAYQQFRLLSKLCQLSNETVNSAIIKFLLQSYVVSNLPTKNDFDAQIENTLSKFYESVVTNFKNLIDVVDLQTQVDQPHMLREINKNAGISGTLSSDDRLNTSDLWKVGFSNLTIQYIRISSFLKSFATVFS